MYTMCVCVGGGSPRVYIRAFSSNSIYLSTLLVRFVIRKSSYSSPSFTIIAINIAVVPGAVLSPVVIFSGLYTPLIA